MISDIDCLLPPTRIIGLMLAAGKADYVSPRPWVLEASLDILERELQGNSPVRRALSRWPRVQSTQVRFGGVGSWLGNLIKAGDLVQDPNASNRLAVSPSWFRVHTRLLDDLPDADRQALEAAGQAALERSRMLSKKSAAS
jgi:hypothetical protein